MVKVLDVVNYTNSLIGRSIDEDGMYGAQCMDLTIHVMNRYFGWHPTGNAINLTSQVIPSGFTRIRISNASEIKAGDVLIWGLGTFAEYGHTAIAVENGSSNGIFVSIDQNWLNPSLTVGSPAARITHNMNGVWGVIRPNYSDGNDSSGGGEYSGGTLTNAGNTISQETIRFVIQAAKPYNIKPSFLIAQMFIESHWGNPNTSIVGSKDNNWSGISEPFNVPNDLGISMSRGSARPANEGGYYVHFATVNDFFKAFAFLLSKRNGLYNVEGTTTIQDYCKGLFRVGGARADYAASGYDHYLSLLVPSYNAINRQNPGKLEQIDSSTGNNNNEMEEFLMWVFYQANSSSPVKWFNGQHIYSLAHPDEKVAINQVYRANTGKDVPTLSSWNDSNPLHARLANVLKRQADY